MKNVLILTVSLLALSSCVSRDQADAKLTKGCVAAANALGPDGGATGTADAVKFTTLPPAADSDRLRQVDLVLKQDDSSSTPVKCVFEEEFGPAKLSYSATLYQLELNDRKYGRYGDHIEGDAQDMIKLTDAVTRAMQ